MRQVNSAYRHRLDVSWEICFCFFYIILRWIHYFYRWDKNVNKVTYVIDSLSRGISMGNIHFFLLHYQYHNTITFTYIWVSYICNWKDKNLGQYCYIIIVIYIRIWTRTVSFTHHYWVKWIVINYIFISK